MENLFTYDTQNLLLSPQIAETESPAFLSTSFFILIIVSFIFLGIAGILIWKYWSIKNNTDLLDKYGEKSAGSFKGYWARYRNAVYAFLAAMFILFAILIFLFAFGLIGAPYTDIT